MTTTAIILDDTTPEELSASDLRQLRTALEAARAARKLSADGFLCTAIAELGRAWSALGRCDELGGAWQAARQAVQASEADVMREIDRPGPCRDGRTSP